MFKITMTSHDRFELTRVHDNEELWTMENLTSKDLCRVMQGRSDRELQDAFIVKSNGVSPFILVEPKYFN